MICERLRFGLCKSEVVPKKDVDKTEACDPPAPDVLWITRQMHIEGSLLIAIAEAETASGEWMLESLDEVDAPFAASQLGATIAGRMYVFAWHLPSCRALFVAQSLPGMITAFAKSVAGGSCER